MVVLAVDIGEDVPVAVAVQLVVVLSDIGEGVPVHDCDDEFTLDCVNRRRCTQTSAMVRRTRTIDVRSPQDDNDVTPLLLSQRPR